MMGTSRACMGSSGKWWSPRRNHFYLEIDMCMKALDVLSSRGTCYLQGMHLGFWFFSLLAGFRACRQECVSTLHAVCNSDNTSLISSLRTQNERLKQIGNILNNNQSTLVQQIEKISY